MKSQVLKKGKVYTRDEFCARIFDAAACIWKREDRLRRTTRGPRTRVTNCVEVDSGIFGLLLWTLPNLSFKH